ncbi:MAG: GIY-YIG nuclease family protein [Pseudomonadota bacterium]|nr:GIY-YIG nuclease family protein [Pseudomonadota bacterium]
MTTDLDELRAELDDYAKPKKQASRSPRDERIIAGFEDILRFVDDHGRTPEHGEDRDIFERLYAVRLDRLRELTDCHELLAGIDTHGLLKAVPAAQDRGLNEIEDDELMAELAGADGLDDITDLRNVRSTAERKAAEEIARRQRCEDFDQFKPLFDQVQSEIASGLRPTVIFGKDASIEQGDFFILGGQLTYVAEIGDEIRTASDGREDVRLRAIFANGTESNMYVISLKRALYKNDASRRVGKPDAGPLFGDRVEEGDQESGTIYVLRSQSSESFVAEHRELIHKIGVTGGSVETRIANARNDATYLLADVDIVATYKLAGINRTKLENLIHRVLAPAQLDLVIRDRFGKPVKPREWFLVPLAVIDQVVDGVRDGSIAEVVYDPKSASLVRK